MSKSRTQIFDKSHQIFFESLYESLSRVESMVEEYIDTTTPLLIDPIENHNEIIIRTVVLDNQLTKAFELVKVYCCLANEMLLRYVNIKQYDGLFKALQDDLTQHMIHLVRCYKDKEPATQSTPQIGVLHDVSDMLVKNDREILRETIEIAHCIADSLRNAEETFASISDEKLSELLNILFAQYEDEHKHELQAFADEGEITTIKELKDDYGHEPLVKLFITKKNNLGGMVRQMRSDGCVMSDIEPLCAFVMRYRYLQKHGKKHNPQIVEINNPAKVIINSSEEKEIDQPPLSCNPIKQAIEDTLSAVDESGKRVFKLQNQWAGVQLVLVWKELYNDSDSSFADYLRELSVEEPEFGFPTKDFSRDTIKDRYDKWQPKGIKEKRIKRVADIFNANLEKYSTK